MAADPEGRAPDSEAILRIEEKNRELLDGLWDEAVEERRTIDLALIPVFSDERPLRGLAAYFDWRWAGRLSAMLREGFCTGRSGETVLMPSRRRLPAKRIILVGMGPSEAFGDECAKESAERFLKLAEGVKAKEVLLALPGELVGRERGELVFRTLMDSLRDVSEAAEGEEKSDVNPDAEVPEREGSDGEECKGGEEEAPTEAKSGEQEAEVVEPGGDALTSSSTEAVEASEASGTSDFDSDSEARSRWWIVANPQVAGRLRRLLAGPPRSAP